MRKKALYALIASEAGKRLLYDLDCLLRGGVGGGQLAPFRLAAAQYTDARDAIAELYAIVRDPQLEPTPPTPITAARSDGMFQDFLGALVAPRRGHRRTGAKGARHG